MSEPNEPEVLAHLKEHGAKTLREIAREFTDKDDDPRQVGHIVRSQLIRLKRRGLVTTIVDPRGGQGKIYSAVPDDEED